MWKRWPGPDPGTRVRSWIASLRLAMTMVGLIAPRYLAHRLVLAAITIFAITLVTFGIVYLPPVDFVDRLCCPGRSLWAIAISAAEALTPSASPTVSTSRSTSNTGSGFPLVALPVTLAALSIRPPSNRGHRRPPLAYHHPLAPGAIVVTWGLALPIGVYSAVRRSSAIMSSPSSVSSASPSPTSCSRSIVMYFGSKYFGISVGGLFSADQQLAPWTWAKVIDLGHHLPIPVLILSLARHCATRADHARQPAR